MEYKITPYITEEELRNRVKELAAQISEDYRGKEILMVSILKGAVVFLTDLMRAVDGDVTIDFMVVSSYGAGVKTSGVVKINKDLDVPLEGREVILVEDILDSGKTLHYLKTMLSDRHPKGIRIATLLDKPERREAPITADYAGFVVPDAFLVGYGLDYAEKYRNLPYIGVLKPEVYAE